MSIYMIQASFTADAWANLCKNPEDRGDEVARQMESLGGKLLSYYYCFGEYDVVIITEAPNDVAMMTAITSASAAGHLKSTKTTKLFTSREAMDAMANALKITFAPPSG